MCPLNLERYSWLFVIRWPKKSRLGNCASETRWIRSCLWQNRSSRALGKQVKKGKLPTELVGVWRQSSVPRERFDLKRYVLERKSLIDRALEHYLNTNHQPGSPLHQALDYSALDGGKRFRPILTLAVGELFEAERSALLPFASAIELIHCYSLIHDDLPALDNDDMRRGKPSCHKRFGEAIALLAGDALLTEAFFIMSDPELARLLPPSMIVKLIREISGAAGIRGMIGGENMGLELGNDVTATALEDMDRLKTGALITTAARLGATIGRASRGDLDRITRYARALGLAFQITDDTLDAHEVSSDGADNKPIANYLSVAGRTGAMERIKVLLAECLKEMEPYGKAAEPLRELARYVAERID